MTQPTGLMMDAARMLFDLSRDEGWTQRLEALRIANALVRVADVTTRGGADEYGRRPLTKRQSEILDYLREYRAAHPYAPSFEEIAKRFGYDSLATVHEHLTNLERKGWIQRAYNQARSIMVVAA